MIRAGHNGDIPAIVDMAEEFWSHTIYEEPYCSDTTEAMLAQSIEQGMLSVLVVNGLLVGFACGIYAPLLGNGSVLTGTELAWWVDPEHRKGRNGIGLLIHLENQAKDAGVKYWNMVYMESSMPQEIKGIYERLGYKRTETTYTRTL